jgi:hypothetical protein
MPTTDRGSTSWAMFLAKNSTLRLVAVGESVFTEQWSFLPPESVYVGTFSPVSVSLMGFERTTGDV